MKNLLKSLAEFQYEAPVIQKSTVIQKTTSGYGYKYADLPSIFDVIKPLMQKHGLAFFQHLGTIDGATFLQTTIYHVESGEKIESQVEIPQVKLKGMNDFQCFGSGVTYYRRYALSCALCLITDVDNEAAGEQEKTQKKQTLNDFQFEKAMQAIEQGAYKLESLENQFQLTEAQKNYLNKLK